MKTKKLFLLTISLLFISSCSMGVDNSSISNTTSSQDPSYGFSSSIDGTSGDSSQESSNTTTSDNQSSSTNSSIGSSEDSSNSSQESSSGQQIGESKLYAATIKNNIPEGYYDSCKGLKGEELKEALHEIIDDHEWFNYSSTQEFYKEIDRDPHDSSKMNFIYTGATNIGTSYNKEHVWAKSHGGFENKYPMHSDLHNLHPCNSNLNSTRGNLDFKEGGDVLTQYNGNNKVNKNVSFEPSDFSKGDTARTIFYMAVRYEGDGSELDLELSKPSSSSYYDFSNGADGTHGNFDDLYKWAISGQDPVDDYEVSRNNVIYSNYQGNRNPFIDHPEFIYMIYDKNYSGPGALLDDNPYQEIILTPQEEVNIFSDYVNQIVVDQINSDEFITKAENYYQKMSDEAKALAQDVYSLFLEKKSQYKEFAKEYLSNRVIELINSIGEVTLESKEIIEQAEKEYLALDEEVKELVKNYQVLLDARARYDILYQEWIESNPSMPFTFNFYESEGATSSYSQNVIVKYQEMEFKFSHVYHAGNDFRLGSNNSAQVSENMKSAIPNIKSNSSSFESLFDIMGRTLTLTYNKNYGTVSNIYLLNSTDGGATYQLIGSQTYDESNKQVSFDISSTRGRYAIVIDGSKPRLCIDSLIVE